MKKETKLKISIAKKGCIPWNKGKIGVYSKESLNKFRKAKLGTKWSDSHRTNMAEIKKDKRHTRWIEDRSKIKMPNRSFNDANYKVWLKIVRTRDKNKCKINTTECNGRIETHHILPWRDYPELRYVVNNGITLCNFHHPRKRDDELRLVRYFSNLIL